MMLDKQLKDISAADKKKAADNAVPTANRLIKGLKER